MSFQAYLATIREKTGKGPDDFKALAAQRGLAGPAVKAADVVAWLAEDFDLGRGHAMAIYAIIKAGDTGRPSTEQRVDKLFSGSREHWRPGFDNLVQQAQALGKDFAMGATDSYVSLMRGTRKFAIVQPSAKHLDIGIKRKGVEPSVRFAEAGTWNTMVTHRVRLTSEAQLDDEVMAWLTHAFAAAG